VAFKRVRLLERENENHRERGEKGMRFEDAPESLPGGYERKTNTGGCILLTLSKREFPRKER